MARQGSTIKIGLYAGAAGANSAGWRHPDAAVDTGVNLKTITEMAQMAERGILDFIFLADSMTMRGHDWDILSRSTDRYTAQFEPMTILSALAASTTHIGLVGTCGTAYEQPYLVARRFASLDLLSGGRSGWNLVTSSNPEEAVNFSREGMDAHADRYERANEFSDVVRGLWHTWDADAFIRDKESGQVFDVNKLHLLNHKGKHFSVRGPLNVPPSPQYHPLLVQAGASEPGKELAAKFAEAIFCSRSGLEDSREFYADVKGRMAKYGRHPDELVIMPGVSFYVAETEEEAHAKRKALLDLIDPVVGRNFLTHMLGDSVDLTQLSDDDHLPPGIPISNSSKSTSEKILEKAYAENLTIREVYIDVMAKGQTMIGTPVQVADQMQEWYETGAADGFIFMMDFYPNSLSDFITMVVPELQKRGLYRTEYTGTTLRENLDLPMPPRPPERTGSTGIPA